MGDFKLFASVMCRCSKYSSTIWSSFFSAVQPIENNWKSCKTNWVSCLTHTIFGMLSTLYAFLRLKLFWAFFNCHFCVHNFHSVLLVSHILCVCPFFTTALFAEIGISNIFRSQPDNNILRFVWNTAKCSSNIFFAACDVRESLFICSSVTEKKTTFYWRERKLSPFFIFFQRCSLNVYQTGSFCSSDWGAKNKSNFT